MPSETIGANGTETPVNRLDGVIPPATDKPKDEFSAEALLADVAKLGQDGADAEARAFIRKWAGRSVVFTAVLANGDRRVQKLTDDAEDGTDESLVKAARLFTVGFSGKGTAGSRKQLGKRVRGTPTSKDDAARHMAVMLVAGQVK